MSNLTLLHRMRQRKGKARQPAYESVLNDLQKRITGMGLSHPFRLIKNRTVDQMTPLLGVKDFATACAGVNGKPTCEFIYHLTSIRKVLTYSQWSYFPNRFPSIDYEDRRIFEYLLHDYSRHNDWLPLSAYSKDHYSGFRRLTWWTNLDLLDGKIVCSAHKLGIPNQWIPKYALVFRCSAESARNNGLTRVPTTVDGFISEIFSPSDLRASPAPTFGQTIDLDSPDRLQAGVQEYVLSSVPVDEIEFKPILIDRPVRLHHVVARNARLWQLLERYYRRL